MQGPGALNNIEANTVIIFGPAGTIVGLFEYATGTVPGLGNLPVAWISQSSTDPYGNALPSPAKDFVSYNHATSTLAWMTQGGLGMQVITDNAAGSIGAQSGKLLLRSPGVIPGDFQASIELHSVHSPGNVTGFQEAVLEAGTVLTSGASPVPVKGGTSVTGGTTTDTLDVTSTSTLTGLVTEQGGVATTGGTTTDTLSVTGTSTFGGKATITAGGLAVTGGTTTDSETVTGQLTADGATNAAPTLVATDSWTTLTVASNGWTATASENARALMLATGSKTPKNLVKLQLDATAGTITDGTQICNIPAPYRPVTTQFLPVHTAGGTAVTNGPGIHILSTGNVQCFGLPTGTTQIHANGDYALD